MKNTIYITLVSLLAVSCWSDKREPNVQYMPNMYYSTAYEAYVEPLDNKGEVVKSVNGITVRTPEAGTIPRGYDAYEEPNTTESYTASLANNENPFAENYSEEKGKFLYDIYCAACHGEKGDGNGILMKREKFAGVPNYADRELSKGSIYHVITYGKGVMGSHAAQLSPKERWQVVEYVNELRNKLKGTAAPAVEAEPAVAE